MGAIDTLSTDQQLEAIYVGYYGRGADSGGFAFWEQQYAAAIASGQTPGQAIVNIANSFAPQTETTTLYPALLNLSQPLDPNSIIAQNAVTAFVNSVYENVFNRPLASGDTYWVDQILNNQVSLGQAILFIENGAIGGDVTTLDNKIAVASSFTDQTSAASLGFGTPSSAYLNEAHVIVAATTDAASGPGSVSAQTAAITTWIGTASAQTFTLTAAADSFSATAAGAIFNALPFVTPDSGLSNNTLNGGDNLQDNRGDGTLNYTATSGPPGAGVANGPYAVGVTLNGINTLNYVGSTEVIGGGGGFQGSVTGLTVVNDTGSTGGLTLGGVGQGLSTALTQVNIVGYAPFGGILLGFVPMFQARIATSAGTSTAPLAVAISGAVGGNALNGAAVLAVSTDGSAGSATSPNAAYTEWDLTVNATAALELSQSPSVGGVSIGGVTTLKLIGAGDVALGQDHVGNWQNLTTIDASGETGAVTITGATSGPGSSNSLVSSSNPDGLFGSVAGLLNEGTGFGGGKFGLTKFDLGTGVTVLDASAATTAEIAALTTTGTAIAGNEIMVANTVLNAATSTTFAGIAGFEDVGIAFVSGATTINDANLPASVTTLLFETAASGPLTVNNGINGLTVDFHGHSDGYAETVNGAAVATATLNLDFGNQVLGLVDHTGFITTTGYTTVDINATGDGVAGHVDIADGITLSSTVISGNSGSLAVNLAGTQDFATPFIIDIPATGSTNGPTSATDVITITDTGHISIGLTNFGTVNGSAAASLSVSDSFYHSTLTGSASGDNFLAGGDGGGLAGTGNTITGGSATDTIVTGIGSNTINLGTGHTGDVVILGSESVGTMTGPGDAAHEGAWGLAVGSTATDIGGAAAPPASIFGNALNGGTSASQTTINGFDVSTGSTDVLRIQASQWDSSHGTNIVGGTDLGLQTIDLTHNVASGDAVLVETATSGGAVTAGANLIEIGGTLTFANAAALATSLQNTFHLETGSLTTGENAHLLVAYSTGSQIHIADVDLVNPGAASSVSTSDHVYASDIVALTGVNSFTALNAHLDHFA